MIYPLKISHNICEPLLVNYFSNEIICKTPQTVALANGFEMVYWASLNRKYLTDLENIDDIHSSQKAAFWSFEKEFPTVVITPNKNDPYIFQKVYSNRSHLSPKFINPNAKSSSLLENLLDDIEALDLLTSTLSKQHPVRLLPHVHTAQVESLANWLSEAGYFVIRYPQIASLVRDLCDKIYVHNEIFLSHPKLAGMRPVCDVAFNLESIKTVAQKLQLAGTCDIAIKSASAVAGTGTYFLSSNAPTNATSIDELLMCPKDIQAVKTSPFLIEEFIPSEFSPTVDIFVTKNGDVTLEGVALQRLRDRKYYDGFYYDPQMQESDWYSQIITASTLIGTILAQRGYQGPANIDYVVSKLNIVSLIELNPRRSALFDGFQIAKKKYGTWNAFQLSAVDHVNCDPTLSLSEIDSSLNDLRVFGDIHVLAVTKISQNSQIVSLWVSTESISSEALMRACISLISVSDSQDSNHIGSFQNYFTESVQRKTSAKAFVTKRICDFRTKDTRSAKAFVSQTAEHP